MLEVNFISRQTGVYLSELTEIM